MLRRRGSLTVGWRLRRTFEVRGGRLVGAVVCLVCVVSEGMIGLVDDFLLGGSR
jgi:hypothetical protein